MTRPTCVIRGEDIKSVEPEDFKGKVERGDLIKLGLCGIKACFLLSLFSLLPHS
jgi:hypothetical protein